MDWNWTNLSTGHGFQIYVRSYLYSPLIMFWLFFHFLWLLLFWVVGLVPRLPRERRKRCKTLGFDLIFFFGWLGQYFACQGRGEQGAKQSDRCCAAKAEFSIHYLAFDLIFLLQELAKLSQKFGENVLDATKKFEKLITDKKDIEGLPATSLGLAAQTAVSTVRQKLSSCIFDN